jgi:hypothetical protein
MSHKTDKPQDYDLNLENEHNDTDEKDKKKKISKANRRIEI